MSESVVKASFCIDRRLLSEVERLRNFENSALSQVARILKIRTALFLGHNPR